VCVIFFLLFVGMLFHISLPPKKQKTNYIQAHALLTSTRAPTDVFGGGTNDSYQKKEILLYQSSIFCENHIALLFDTLPVSFDSCLP
jgi:hypothetical protein